MLQVMLSLGLLVPHGDQKKLCEGLAMPAFPKLSVQRCYALTLLNLLPDNKPVPYLPSPLFLYLSIPYFVRELMITNFLTCFLGYGYYAKTPTKFSSEFVPLPLLPFN